MWLPNIKSGSGVRTRWSSKWLDQWVAQFAFFPERLPESLERFKSTRKLLINFSTRATYAMAREHWPSQRRITGRGRALRALMDQCFNRVEMVKHVANYLQSREEVTIDFTESYGCNGTWVGGRLADRIDPYSYITHKKVDAFSGIDVKIQCSDPRQEEYILRYIIRAENPWEEEEKTEVESSGEEQDGEEQHDDGDDMDLDGNNSVNGDLSDSDEESSNGDGRKREDMDGERERSERLRNYSALLSLGDVDSKPASTT